MKNTSGSIRRSSISALIIVNSLRHIMIAPAVGSDGPRGRSVAGLPFADFRVIFTMRLGGGYVHCPGVKKSVPAAQGLSTPANASKRENLRGIGRVAQLVEQRTENPCVAGSIPAPTTESKRKAAMEVAAYSVRGAGRRFGSET
jgi:hypothetical protein